MPGFVITVAGTGASGSAIGGADGAGTNVYMASTWGIAVDSGGGVYYADHNGYTIRYLSSAGTQRFCSMDR